MTKTWCMSLSTTMGWTALSRWAQRLTRTTRTIFLEVSVSHLPDFSTLFLSMKMETFDTKKQLFWFLVHDIGNDFFKLIFDGRVNVETELPPEVIG